MDEIVGGGTIHGPRFPHASADWTPAAAIAAALSDNVEPGAEYWDAMPVNVAAVHLRQKD